MRFEVTAAFVMGLLLPLLETWRRGISHWSVDFTTMFEDYVAGVLLLIAAWGAYRLRPWGTLLLVVAWAGITAMMSISLVDQLEGTFRNISTEPHNLLVVLIKFLLWGTCIISLFFSFQRASNTGTT